MSSGVRAVARTCCERERRNLCHRPPRPTLGGEFLTRRDTNPIDPADVVDDLLPAAAALAELLGEQELLGPIDIDREQVDDGRPIQDAAAVDEIATLAQQDRESFNNVRGEQAQHVNAPMTQANLIAFGSGWGDGAYPVWIGRTADGKAACFIADMLLLRDATLI